MLSTTPAPNSTYWLLGACHSEGMRDHAKVRLDPLLHGPASEFDASRYAMLVYGQPLDWDRIEDLFETEHGRWRPDSLNGRSHCTEYAWDPRDSEVTFVCEEVPMVEAATCVPGRYLHAIYLPAEAAICHLDAAVRIYSNSEISKRHTQHVRNAGKIGFREKVLRIDDLVSREALSSVCQAFFVWNEDVRRYFGQAGNDDPGNMDWKHARPEAEA